MKKIKAHYLRVSTKEQNIERQMSDSGKELIIDSKRFLEKDSGRIPFHKRKVAMELIEDIENGLIHTVCVHSISRLGRDTVDVLNTVKYFTSKGVCLISEKENIKTLNDDGSENLIASMIVGIMSTLSEWDYNKIRQNTREGIAIAKAKGKYKGRKVGSGMSTEAYLKKYKKVVKVLEAKNSLRDTAKLCEVSLSTVQKVQRELQGKSRTTSPGTNDNEMYIEHLENYEPFIKS